MAMAVGIGCSASQTLAVLEGLLSDDATFARTPKKGADGHTKVIPAVPWLRAGLTGAMALYLSAALAWAAVQGWWFSLPFMLLFAAGFVSVSLKLWLEGHRAVESAEMGALPATK